MNRILLLDSEADSNKNLNSLLKREGYLPHFCYTGKETVQTALSHDFDLMILGINLNKEQSSRQYTNGMEVARVITQTKDTPYIFLTTRTEPLDIMQGLDFGAEDYIGKPFDCCELLARIRAVLRTTQKNKEVSNLIIVGDLTIDIQRREVRKKNIILSLSRNIYWLLEYMALNKGITLSKEILLHDVWGENAFYDNSHVASNIRRLRQVIGSEYIINKRGLGYIFDDPV